MAALTRRERVSIGTGVVAALALTGYIYAAEPVMNRQRELAELIPAREATLEQRRLLIAQRDRLVGELGGITTRLQEASARLLPGPTAPLAASQLQKLAKDVAASANVEARSERVLPPLDRGGLQEVPIEIAVAGNIRETMTLLSQLERMREGTGPLVTLKSVRIRVVAVGQPRGILTTLTVTGYLIPPGQVATPREASWPVANVSPRPS